MPYRLSWTHVPLAPLSENVGPRLASSSVVVILCRRSVFKPINGSCLMHKGDNHSCYTFLNMRDRDTFALYHFSNAVGYIEDELRRGIALLWFLITIHCIFNKKINYHFEIQKETKGFLKTVYCEVLNLPPLFLSLVLLFALLVLSLCRKRNLILHLEFLVRLYLFHPMASFFY